MESILFLCHGNICRSPFAQRYLASQLSSEVISVESAGFHPESGRSSPEAAIQAAAQYDVRLADHTSRVITDEMIRENDLVFLMDVRNYLSWKRNYANSRPDPFLLGSLLPANRNDFELADPFGGNIAEFESVYRDIVTCIDYLITRVIEP